MHIAYEHMSILFLSLAYQKDMIGDYGNDDETTTLPEATDSGK